jgi:hypothetical protein
MEFVWGLIAVYFIGICIVLGILQGKADAWREFREKLEREERERQDTTRPPH